MGQEPISFICEHTAEYVLVPMATEALRIGYRLVVPFFFWSNREGAAISRRIGLRGRVRIVTIFARRPKLNRDGDERIIVRINDDLFCHARESMQYGIPVYAGVPLVRSFEDLGADPICLWLRINPSPLQFSLSTVDVSVDGGKACSPLADGLYRLELSNFPSDVYNSTYEMWWPEAIDALRAVRSASRKHGGMWPFAQYRPFHMLLQS